MSSPTAALISTSWRQVANRSFQASTTNSCDPTTDGLNVPDQSSVPVARSASGATCQVRLPSRRHRTRAPIRSWPSWKTVARTVTTSPTTALAGNSRVGVVGVTASMVMRPSIYTRVGADAGAADRSA